MYCPHCGAQNPGEAKFCGNCGKDFSAIKQPNDNSSDKNNDDKSPFFKLLFSFGRKRKLVITFGVILLAMIPVIYFYSGNGESAYENAVASQATSLAQDYEARLDINNIEMYYTSNVTREDAQKAGKYLISSNFFHDNKAIVQIDKNAKSYVLKYIAPSKEVTKNDYLKIMVLQNEVSNIAFNGKPVEINLADSSFKTFRVINQNENAGGEVIIVSKNNDENSKENKPNNSTNNTISNNKDFGKLIMDYNGGRLYAANSMQEIEARRIGAILASIGYFDGNEQTIQLSIDGKTLVFKQIVPDGMEKDAATIKDARSKALLIAQKGLSKSNFEYQLTDVNLKGISIYKHNPNDSNSNNANSSSIDYGKMIEYKDAKFYYTESIQEGTAKKIADILFKKGFFNGEIKTVQFSQDSKKFLVKEIIPKGMEKDEKILESGKSSVEFLRKNIFGSRPFEIQLTDVNLKVFYSIKSGF